MSESWLLQLTRPGRCRDCMTEVLGVTVSQRTAQTTGSYCAIGGWSCML